MNKTNRRHYSAKALKFSLDAWLKLVYMCQKADTEISGYGVTAFEDPLLVIDFRLVDQESTVYTSNMSDDGVANYMDEMIDEGYAVKQFSRVWIHTHPFDGAEPSHVDEECFARSFVEQDYGIMVIVSKTCNVYARLTHFKPPSSSVRLDVRVDWSTLPELIATGLQFSAEELDEQLRIKVREPRKDKIATYGHIPTGVGLFDDIDDAGNLAGTEFHYHDDRQVYVPRDAYERGSSGTYTRIDKGRTERRPQTPRIVTSDDLSRGELAIDDTSGRLILKKSNTAGTRGGEAASRSDTGSKAPSDRVWELLGSWAPYGYELKTFQKWLDEHAAAEKTPEGPRSQYFWSYGQAELSNLMSNWIPDVDERAALQRYVDDLQQELGEKAEKDDAKYGRSRRPYYADDYTSHGDFDGSSYSSRSYYSKVISPEKAKQDKEELLKNLKKELSKTLDESTFDVEFGNAESDQP